LNKGVDGQKSTLTREQRQQRIRKLKVAVVVAGLAGSTFFAGLAAAASQSGFRPGATNPDQQIVRLENANGGAFFSTGGVFAPSSGGGQAQASSGGS
jgi:molybdopterin/thiamine biosynthesis adenylyltransferase